MKVRRLLIMVAALTALAAPATARADTVTDWNLYASNALFNTAGQGPQLSVPHLAMVHGAVYDAVNAIDRRYDPYVYSTRRVLPWTSKDAAAATAAYKVLVSLVPAQQPALEALYQASLAGIPEWSAKWDGIAIGEAAAAAMIAARTNDGRFGTPGFATGLLPGQWRPVLPAFVNDPAAWLRNVKPFLVESSSQFRSAGPHPLTSAAYAMEFNEVKSLGQDTSATRTAFQTNSARYWAENPPRTWSRIFRTLSAQQGLSLEENARLYAMLYTTAADALITVWDDKAHFGFWRPITAIREAESDGNPATTADPTWLPLIATPPYPEHSSGHAGLSASFSATLEDFFGTNDIGWSDTNVGGLSRSFTRFSDAADEVVEARIWSGIHVRAANVQGALIGRQVADWRQAHYFQRRNRG